MHPAQGEKLHVLSSSAVITVLSFASIGPLLSCVCVLMCVSGHSEQCF